MMLEWTAAGLHIDNEESLKKIKNVKDCYTRKKELNKIKKSKRFISRSPFFSMNVKFQLPNQWFRAGAYLVAQGRCAVPPLFFDSAFQ